MIPTTQNLLFPSTSPRAVFPDGMAPEGGILAEFTNLLTSLLETAAPLLSSNSGTGSAPALSQPETALLPPAARMALTCTAEAEMTSTRPTTANVALALPPRLPEDIHENQPEAAFPPESAFPAEPEIPAAPIFSTPTPTPTPTSEKADPKKTSPEETDSKEAVSDEVLTEEIASRPSLFSPQNLSSSPQKTPGKAKEVSSPEMVERVKTPSRQGDASSTLPLAPEAPPNIAAAEPPMAACIDASVPAAPCLPQEAENTSPADPAPLSISPQKETAKIPASGMAQETTTAESNPLAEKPSVPEKRETASFTEVLSPSTKHALTSKNTPALKSEDPVGDSLAAKHPLEQTLPAMTARQAGETVAKTALPPSAHRTMTAKNAPAQQVAIHMEKGFAKGQTTIHMKLDPEELGSIDISLSIDENRHIRANITAERPQTLDILRKDADTLEKALSTTGLKTEQGGLSFNLKQGGEHSAQQAFTQNQKSFHSPHSRQATTSVQAQAEPPAPQAYAYRGALNITI